MVPRFGVHGVSHLSFGLFRGPLSEGGVDPPSVTIALDTREQVVLGILAGRTSHLVRESSPVQLRDLRRLVRWRRHRRGTRVSPLYRAVPPRPTVHRFRSNDDQIPTCINGRPLHSISATVARSNSGKTSRSSSALNTSMPSRAWQSCSLNRGIISRELPECSDDGQLLY